MSRESLWEPAIDGWVVALTAAGRPATTVGLRRYHLRRLATEQPHGPATLTGEHLAEWAASHQWARETRRSYRSSLRSFFRWTVHVGIRTDDPSETLGKVRPTDPSPRPASRRAIEQALDRAGPRERLAIRLGAEAGLRRGEIARIHTRDIVDDVVGWSLNVRGKGGQGSITRTVPLPDLLALDMLSAADCTGWLFPGGQGGHLAPQRVGDLVSVALPGDWTAHSLRHRAGTRWFHLDHDLLTVRDLLGHSSVATTQGYVAVEHDDARRTVTTGAVS